MAETLEALVDLARGGVPPRVVVWAAQLASGGRARHGDGRSGELNLGQLVRERHGGDAVLVGCRTHAGTVTAARDWAAPAERRRVRPGLPGSFEELFHEVGVPRFLLPLGEGPGGASELLDEPRLQRAIGVVYRPETERRSHYFDALLPQQFDAVIHVDRTRAVEPLERTPR